jgi:acetyl-CoA acetyltransferase
MNNISGKAAIVGIGMSQFSRNSGKTELRMSCEVIRDALDDAGLVPLDIDGLVKQTDDASDEHAVTSSMGMDNLTFFGECRWDGAPCAMVLRAAVGVVAGVANYIVVYRAVNGASGVRMIPSMRTSGQMSTADLLQWTFHAPFGHVSEAGRVAMIARRYMHEFGATSKQFGCVTNVCREHGAKNPNGLYYNKPITIEEHQRSQSVVEPLRVLDCHEEADCAIALVITTTEKARDLRQKPVYVLGAAQTMVPETEEKNTYYRPDIVELLEVRDSGQRAFEMAGVGTKDIDVAQLDDSYSLFVPMQLEALGFCGRGEGAAFCEGGDRIRLGGTLPMNTSGGSLGEGYIHGMNHIVEGARQIRGTSPNQVKDAKLSLVATGAGGPASALILGGNR